MIDYTQGESESRFFLLDLSPLSIHTVWVLVCSQVDEEACHAERVALLIIHTV